MHVSSNRTDVGFPNGGKDFTKLVSVVIPCYNKADFLGEAIESVLRQTYRHFEIIVVDDGSSDNSGAIATRYSIVHYLYQSNQGPSVARNNGLWASKGNYVVFLDADDRLLPSALDIGVNVLEAHPEYAFVSGHIHLITKDGLYIRTPEGSCVETDHYQALLHGNYIWTPAAVMFRRSVFDSIAGYSPVRCGAEDWDLYLRITRSFPVYCHDKVVTEYRVYANQMTGNSAHMLKDCLACLHQQWPYVKGKKLFEEAYRKGIKEAQNYYGEPLVNEFWAHVKASQWQQAIAGLTALLRYDPRRFVRCVSRVYQHSTMHRKIDE